MDALTKDYDLENLTSDIKSFNLITLPKTSEKQMISFILDLVKEYAVKQKNPILLFSFEMSTEQFVVKLIVSHSKVKSSNLSTQDWKKTLEMAGTLFKAPVFIDDHPNMTVKDISSKIKRLKKKKKLELIIIDNFYLIKSFNHTNNQDKPEATSTEDELKKLTKKLKIPIITFYPAKQYEYKI